MSEPLRRSVTVRCGVQHAFDVFTSQLDMWWPPSHKHDSTAELILEPREGGRFMERRGGDERVLGTVLVWEPPAKLSYTWFPGALQGPTQVDVLFRADGDKTTVQVVHYEGQSQLGEQWQERVQLFARAWATVLPAFEEYANAASAVATESS